MCTSQNLNFWNRLSTMPVVPIAAGPGLLWSQYPSSPSMMLFDESRMVTRFHLIAQHTQALLRMKILQTSGTISRNRLCNCIHQIARRISGPLQRGICCPQVRHTQTRLVHSIISDVIPVTLSTTEHLTETPSTCLQMLAVLWRMMRTLTLGLTRSNGRGRIPSGNGHRRLSCNDT